MDQGLARCDATRTVLRLAGGFLLAGAAALAAVPAAAPAATPSPLRAAAAAEEGMPSCQECHEEAVDAFAGGSHRTLMRSGGTDALGTCSLCHGPADPVHPESGGEEGVIRFSKMEPDAMAAACGRCHTGHPDHVRDWKTSEFREGGLACSECHKVHEKSPNVIHLPVADAERGTVGPAACRVCHATRVESAASSIHAKVVADPVLDSCEMCHVGGAKHLEAIRAEKPPPGAGFAKENTCLLCHPQMPGEHAKNLRPSVLAELPSPLTAAQCTRCHDPHLPAAHTASGRGLAGRPTEDDLIKAGAKPARITSCERCHATRVKEFPLTLCSTMEGKRGAAACETCHGPGSLHVETGGNRHAIVAASHDSAETQAAFCLRCHTERVPDHATHFAASPYSKDGRTCTTCHDVHSIIPEHPEEGFATVAESRAGTTPVGSATCVNCHVNPHPDIERSRHGPLFAKGGGAASGAGCEGCHGNGAAHAALAGRTNLIINPRNLSGKAMDDLCRSCHEKTSDPVAWARQPHGKAAIGCLTCHDPFGPVGAPARAPQPVLCAQCHPLQVAQFQLPSHHPVPEGALSCSDCHDLHRPAPAARAWQAWTDTCAKCHPFEAAPRMYRHEASRTGGCVTCHEPHGTTSPRLLRFSRPADLCLSCHIPPPSHDLAPGGAYGSCLACHTEIHGSDAHPQFLR